MTYEDSRAIAERCPAVAHVSPYLFPTNGLHTARYKGNDVYGVNMGGTEEGYTAGGTTMKFGRFFTDEESRHHAPVVVIGEAVHKRLFADTDPIDKWIEVDGHSMQIIGVMDTSLRLWSAYEVKREVFFDGEVTPQRLQERFRATW